MGDDDAPAGEASDPLVVVAHRIDGVPQGARVCVVVRAAPAPALHLPDPPPPQEARWGAPDGDWEPAAVWNVPRPLGCLRGDAAELHVAVREGDEGGEELAAGRVAAAALPPPGGGGAVWRGGGLTLRLSAAPPAPARKTVYFVRHGTSTWNEAQAACELGTMFGGVDHPLSRAGVKQALRLRAALAAGGADEARVSGAGAVWTSPLARAAQTALIALHPLLSKEGAAPLRVRKAARERRNVGSRDSQGRGVGAEWAAGLCADAARLCGEPVVGPASVDAAEAAARWWDDGAESDAAVAARIRDLLLQLRYAAEEEIILVSHSHLGRELMRATLAADAELHGTDAERLRSWVLSNCGVAALGFDFGRPAAEACVDVELLFDTSLQERGSSGAEGGKRACGMCGL